MDLTLYKNITTSRGLTYNYYYTPPRHEKPTLLFLHGFPSTSYDWHHQAEFFQAKDYGIVVPDMLGYGGTAKPESPEAYAPSLIVKDIIDILDAENIDTVISISHDWGSRINSRLVNFYPERLKALAFLAVGYLPPSHDSNTTQVFGSVKETFDYELFGYWLFFNEDSAAKLIESNYESFHSLLFPSDPRLWKTHMGPPGAAKAWIEGNKTAPPASYLTEKDKRITKDALLQGGLEGPLNWYKIIIRGITAKDDKLVPLNNTDIAQPVFFGGCAQDYIGRPALQMTLANYAKNLTYREFDADHWAMLSQPDKVNKALLEWIEESA